MWHYSPLNPPITFGHSGWSSSRENSNVIFAFTGISFIDSIPFQAWLPYKGIRFIVLYPPKHSHNLRMVPFWFSLAHLGINVQRAFHKFIIDLISGNPARPPFNGTTPRSVNEITHSDTYNFQNHSFLNDLFIKETTCLSS